MAVEPGHSPQQEANRCLLLLVWEHFHVGQTGGVIHCHVSLFTTGSTRRTETPIASDPVADPLKTGELLDVDMDHVARLSPLVSPHGHRWLQILETAQTYGLEGTPHS
jgi:hypothetical protein